MAVSPLVRAQQDPLISQYMLSSPFYNPSTAGISGMVCVTALNRQQWIGLEGAPVTTGFTATTPLRLFGLSSGVGVMLRNDKIGFDNDISFSLSYAYFMNAGSGILGIGLRGGVINKTLDPNWIIPSGSSHIPASGDPLIPESKESVIIPDFDAGLFFMADNYYAGLSVTHLNRPSVKYAEGGPYLTRHFYLTGGYNFITANPLIEIEPSLMLFSDARVVQLTLSSIVTYNKKVWGGVSYRAGDAIIGMAGVELYNGVRIGYAYDFSMTDIRRNTSGSHEFLINYCFELGLGRSPGKYKSVRIL